MLMVLQFSDCFSPLVQSSTSVHAKKGAVIHPSIIYHLFEKRITEFTEIESVTLDHFAKLLADYLKNNQRLYPLIL